MLSHHLQHKLLLFQRPRTRALRLLLREVSANDLLSPVVQLSHGVLVIEVDSRMIAVDDSFTWDGAAWVLWVHSGGIEIKRELAVVLSSEDGIAKIDRDVVERFVEPRPLRSVFGLKFVSGTFEGTS